MKIIVSCVAFDGGKSGISDYIISVVEELLVEHDVQLLIHPSDAQLFPLKSNSLSYIFISEKLKSPLVSMFWHLYILPFVIKKHNFDLLFLPAGNRRLMASYPSNTVITFHDLSQYYIPAKYDAFRMFYIKRIIPHYLRKAPRILAISESTKKDLVRFYKIPASNIDVNYNGYRPRKMQTSISQEDLQKKFSINKNYLLYVARIEHPGKNHINLIKAYEILPEHLSDQYDLVCIGGLWNGSEIVLETAGKSHRADKIHFPGFVSNEEMAAFYKYASLYVFPSLYEGFGIPMLEAFAAGIPVVCSNRSSLPEIGGNAVRTFNPEQPNEIADAIVTVLEGSDLRQEMVSNGTARLGLFSWRDHARKIVAEIP